MKRLPEPIADFDADQRIHAALADAEKLGEPGSSSTLGLGGRSPAASLPAGVLPADFLPGYRLQREVHRGGQGIVYHAVQLSTNQSVAIKVMRAGLLALDTPASGPAEGGLRPEGRRACQGLASSSESIRFQREVQILAEMNHPQIVAIRDTDEAFGLRYIVMDFVDGIPIDEYVARHQNPGRQVRGPAAPAHQARGSVVPGRQARGSQNPGRQGRGSGRTEIVDVLRLFASVCDAVNAAHLRGVIHRDLKPSNILVVAQGSEFGAAVGSGLGTQDSRRSR